MPEPDEIRLTREHLNRKSSSSNTAPIILLTGRPGTGKTTAIQHVVKALGNRAGGFRKRYAQRARTARIGAANGL